MSVRQTGFAFILLAAACAASSTRAAHSPAALAPAPADQDRAHTMAFVHVEEDAVGWLVAADPRLALRADATAPDAIVSRIGTDAVLAEDTSAQIRNGSLDLFAFRARRRALDEAAKIVAGFRDSLPDTAPLGTTVARPSLERELLGRLIDEERARADDESPLGDASGDLVRGIVATWTAPAAPQDLLDRDVWVSKHLLEIRESLRDPGPHAGPSNLDLALYPLERLLAPMQFPRGSAAIAEVRMALDADMRTVPSHGAVDRIARAMRVHIGVSIDPGTMTQRLDHIEERLREVANAALASSASKSDVEARARELLFVERPCSAVPDSRVRSMAPPPEREAICGALRALEDAPAPALVALHDDVLLSFAAVVSSPPSRSRLMSHPDDDDVSALQRKARERPVLALGVALAAELLYATEGADDRLRAWRALGEAPLDVVAREVGASSFQLRP
ncbi:MAG: hypothetical protein M3O46_12700 [Myxococcota bacterium]|nr:hypothetical protein [Myxococcota bacterium]